MTSLEDKFLLVKQTRQDFLTCLKTISGISLKTTIMLVVLNG
jgi:hypothetical protein